jgi:hypothetical protein
VDSLHYRAQQALVMLVMEAVGLKDADARIAAIEKGPMPRCGVFRLGNLRGPGEGKQELVEFLGRYGESLKTGEYRTLFEEERTI